VAIATLESERASGPAAGPAPDGTPLREPPAVDLPRAIQVVRFSRRQIEFVFRARRELGEVFCMKAGISGDVIVSSHPDHARSLFTAKPELVPTLTSESPLRPFVGPSSVLTTNGPGHLRQRRLLLPPFHGDAIARYTDMIGVVTEREIASWPVGTPFALAPHMQAITLEVIMSGIFGIEGPPAPGTPEARLVAAIRYLTSASTSPLAKIAEIANTGRDEPVGFSRLGAARLNRAIFAVIDARRDADLGERHDILSLLLQVTDEGGEPLTASELRDQLVTLLLAGFETTANSLAWTWERLLRNREAHERLVSAVREERDADEQIDATIYETMRNRPVIPIVGRRVAVPWQLGEYVVPADSAVSISVLLLHHREELYPEPFAFRPERWLGGRTPGTYEWIPFGGGTRRCLGAALAMAEQRVVLRAMAERLDLRAERPEPERALHRNVTMIPARGARAVVVARH